MSGSHHISLLPDQHTSEPTRTWLQEYREMATKLLLITEHGIVLLRAPSQQPCYLPVADSLPPHNKEIKHGALRRAALGGTNQQQWLEFSGASFMASFTHSALLQFLCDWLYYYLCFKEDAEAWRSQTTCLVTP